MTAPSIEEMERLEKAATKGPWVTAFGETTEAPKYAICVADGYVCSPTDDHDADFIAASRSFVPWAIGALRAKDREIEELRKFIQWEKDTLQGNIDSARLLLARLDAAKGTKG